jgi:hypothetical protein
LKRLMIWQVRSDLFWCFGYRATGIMEYCNIQKNVMHSKQWRTSYLCCSWCS